MTIIIPMAGLSKRFTDSGFTLPKYMLYAREKSLFNLAVSSFKTYFKTEKFLFIARDVFCTKEFIQKECELLGISFFDIVILKEPTKGQAETVYLGIALSKITDSDPILIFNIDTFRPNYSFPIQLKNWDGYLEVFEGDGANWSYAKTAHKNSTKVIQTAEKEEISNFCSTGIYYFKKKEWFMEAFDAANIDISKIKLNELYVAPLYNYLIAKGQEIHIEIIKREEVIFCGVPTEYFDYINKF
ncbi:glycosyltransferase family 2 protein [Flavobacterium sp.]|jgi:hypothetical protein|uniref:glycosyltransferase family 2 protein n=1 Tax=Flavobacterium sp. TaxID=239 RepID=UPI0037BF4903